MASLNDLEDKVDEIFCIQQLTEHVDQFGIIRLADLAIKLLEDLERLRKNSKEVVLCKRIVEFLVALIKSCLSANVALQDSPSFSRSALNSSSNGQTNIADFGGQDVDAQDSVGSDDKNSPGKKKRPPTPPKKPKIGRSFHSFQYVPSSKENLSESGASNSSLATTCSNQSQSTAKSPSSQPGSITATRTSSTFGSNNKSPASLVSNKNGAPTDVKTTKTLTKYTETCLDRDTTAAEDGTQMSTFGAGRPAALSSSFGGRKYASVNRTRPSMAAAAASPTLAGGVITSSSTPQQHNSYPRHLHSSQQIRGQLSNLGASPSFGQSSLKSPASLSRHFNYGSNDALNRRFNKMKAASLDSDAGGGDNAEGGIADKVSSPVIGAGEDSRIGNGRPVVPSVAMVGTRLARCRSQDSGGPTAGQGDGSENNSSSRFNAAVSSKSTRDSNECLVASDEEPLTDKRKQSLDDHHHYDDDREVDIDDDDDEAIYDTVAPDELTNYNQPRANLTTTTITTNNNGTKSSSASETTTSRPVFIKQNSLVKSLKNTFENRILAQSMENLDLHASSSDPHHLHHQPGSSADGRFANYVNIDYFLRSKNDSDECETQMSQSLSSDHDIDESLSKLNNTSSSNLLDVGGGGHNTSSLISTSNDSILSEPSSSATGPSAAHTTGSIILGHNEPAAVYDEVFEIKQKPHHRSPNLTDSSMFKCSVESTDDELGDSENVRSEPDLLNMYKCIVQNIIESETVYVDCLNTLIQYKKALKTSTEYKEPYLRAEQLEYIFFQIPQLYQIHLEFLAGVQRLSQSSGDNSIIKIRTNTPTLGDLFKALASRLDVYSAYLKNYANALQTLHKCCAQNSRFSEIVKVNFSLSYACGCGGSLNCLKREREWLLQDHHHFFHCVCSVWTDGRHTSLRVLFLQMTDCLFNRCFGEFFIVALSFVFRV